MKKETLEVIQRVFRGELKYQPRSIGESRRISAADRFFLADNDDGVVGDICNTEVLDGLGGTIKIWCKSYFRQTQNSHKSAEPSFLIIEISPLLPVISSHTRTARPALLVCWRNEISHESSDHCRF